MRCFNVFVIRVSLLLLVVIFIWLLLWSVVIVVCRVGEPCRVKLFLAVLALISLVIIVVIGALLASSLIWGRRVCLLLVSSSLVVVVLARVPALLTDSFTLVVSEILVRPVSFVTIGFV